MEGLPPLADENFWCRSCDFVFGSVSSYAAGSIVTSVAGEIVSDLSAVPEDELRQRDQPGIWTVLEYVCHLRDVFATYTIRLHRAVLEDEPSVDPMFGDLRAVRFGYNSLSVDGVLSELTAYADGLATEIGVTPDDSWSRTVTRQPHERRTALWLVRQAAHEALHHQADIGRIRKAG